jgi:uncharacterized protein (UPF0276 family)
MKIGCNYSEELMELIESGEVDVDFIKIGYFNPFMGIHDDVVKTKPILIHGFGKFEHIGMVDPKRNNDWSYMNEVLAKYDTQHMAVHFAIYDQDLQGVCDCRNRLEEGLAIFKENLEVPLLIENMDYNPFYNRLAVRREAVDPDYINEICHKYDVGLLLDTAHASVSAYHLKMDVHDYISRLPLDQVKEIHFVGTQLTEDQGLKDMHTPLTHRDYDLLDWLKGLCDPEIVTLEYGWPGSEYIWRTDKEAIKKQLNEIKRRY